MRAIIEQLNGKPDPHIGAYITIDAEVGQVWFTLGYPEDDEHKIAVPISPDKALDVSASLKAVAQSVIRGTE